MTGNLTPGGNRGRTFPAEPLSQVEVQQLMDEAMEHATRYVEFLEARR